MKRLVLIVFSISLLAALCLFWFRNTEPYPMCGIAERSYEDMDPFSVPETNIIDDIKQWFYEILKEDIPAPEWHYRMVELPAADQAKLERIFSSYDLKTEGTNDREGPFIGFAGSFIVAGKDGDAHILNMYIRIPEFNVALFSLDKIEYEGNGIWKLSEKPENRHFVSPKLYGELEEFIKNLPASNPTRQKYERMHATFDKLLEEKERQKQKN